MLAKLVLSVLGGLLASKSIEFSLDSSSSSFGVLLCGKWEIFSYAPSGTQSNGEYQA